MKTVLALVHEKVAASAGEEQSERSPTLRRAKHSPDNTRMAGFVSCNEQLAMIEAAISRLDKGTFGLCVGCGDRLELTKLTENPTSALCRKCEEKS